MCARSAIPRPRILLRETISAMPCGTASRSTRATPSSSRSGTRRIFPLTTEERAAVCDLVVVCRGLIEENFSPDGYNVGFNVGEAGGQTIFHCNCHVIPRYAGDVPEPEGGVRGVVPERRGY